MISILQAVGRAEPETRAKILAFQNPTVKAMYQANVKPNDINRNLLFMAKVINDNGKKYNAKSINTVKYILDNSQWENKNKVMKYINKVAANNKVKLNIKNISGYYIKK